MNEFQNNKFVREGWISAFVTDDLTHRLAPLSETENRELYRNYRSFAPEMNMTGNGKIFYNPRAVRDVYGGVTTYYQPYLVLEDIWLERYYQYVAEYWWSLLPAEDKVKFLDQWVGTAIDAGVTAEDAKGEVQVVITEDMFARYTRFKGLPAISFKPPEADLEYFRAAFGISSWNSYSNDGYILRVKTGILDGTNVMYLGVRYRDVNGFERTEFIFPHEGSLSEGFRAAELAGSPSERLDVVESTTGYTVKNGYGETDGLTSGSLDFYYIRPRYELEEVLGVDVFMRYPSEEGASTKGWTCEGMHFYRVDELYGVRMAGYYSDSYYISFRGELISMLQSQSGAVDFELDKSDALIRLGRETGTGYSFVRVNQPYDSRNDEFYFKTDLADVYGGGLEALATRYTDGRRLLNVVEALTLSVTYLDSFGEKQVVNMPMITSQLAWAVESGVLNGSTLPIAGVAQQGDHIVFPGLLPNFAELVNVELTVGPKAADAAGITATVTDGRTKRLEELAGDVINITGMQIFGSDVKASVYVDGAVLRTEIPTNAAPLYYFLVRDENGLALPGGRYDLTERFTAYTPGSSVYPEHGSSDFVVVISTDDVDRAGTEEDVFFKIGYLSTSGIEKESDQINLRDAAREIYGYWPGMGGDTAYEVGVSQGSQLILTLSLNDVNKFTSATFSVGPSCKDDWQMKEIRIYSSSTLSERKITWEAVPGSDRRITREFGASDKKLVARFPNALDNAEDSKVYLGGDSISKKISFGENSRSVIEEDEPINWNEIRYSMTFKEALQDLGFDRSAATYKVEVKVAGNGEADNSNGDCGSQNLFYFKLLFENGSSGYVLANQQLTADGFRADRVETFYVTTNEDFGSLTAVSIIPEDDSGSDNQDPFDKLNISSITVSKQSSDSLSMTWKISRVGWIDVNYRDKGAESTAGGRKGRSEGELAHTYSVDTKGYSLNLLFTLSTGSYLRSADDVFASDTNTTNPAFRGSLVATIEYYDNTGSIRKESIDVVRAIYEYAALDPQYYNESAIKADNADETRCKSDPDFMFRGDHIDRFIVSLPDVRQIVRIRFGASSEVSTLWRLNSVKISQITSDGDLQLDSRGEYKRTNKTELLCESADTMGYELRVFAPENRSETLGEEQGLTVNLTSHQLDIKTSGGDWTSSITREPVNKNDTLNIYVYMKKGVRTDDPIGSYEMKGNVNWYNGDGDFSRSDSLGVMTKHTEQNMFSYTGLKVSGFQGLNKVLLQASSRDGLMAHADYMIIQHVRSGVLLETYYVNLANENLFNGGTYSRFDGTDPARKGEKQTVKIAVSADSDISPKLQADETDLAVAIHYRTQQDIDRGDTSLSYNSRYVFLTDLKGADGLPMYNKITPGMTFELPFAESYIGEITGVTLVTTGGYEILLDAACVEITNSEGKCAGWFDLASGGTVSATPYTVTTTEKNVVPVEMTFTTLENAEILSEGTDSGDVPPIRMTVVYTSALSGTRQEWVIPDIGRYLTSGQFRIEDKNDTATVRFFMKDVSAIRSIILEPYTTSASGNAVWGVGDVHYEACVGGSVKSHTSYAISRDVSGRSASEGVPLAVNLSTVAIRLTASAFMTETGVTAERTSGYGGSTELTVKAGQTVTVTPEVTGSLDGYGFEVLITRDDGTALPSTAYTYDGEHASFTFTAPEPVTESPEVYTITVSSAEEPIKQCALVLKVGD